MFRKLAEGKPKERGQTLVLVAVMMVALVGLTAMAVDLSFVFVQRRDMQNAADAGALAGARLLALYAANPTLAYRYRDIYLAAINTAQANGADNISAFLIHCGDRNTYYELRPNDYGGIQRCDACGVWVSTEVSFGTFFSQMFGVHSLNASAEAQAEFGLPKSVKGLAPIALRETAFNVGDTYTFWDNYKQAGGANRGWLGLDCVYPDKGSECSPDANSLKQWMDPPYYPGDVYRGWTMGGDPGTKASVLDHANPPDEVLVIPVYDWVVHYTNNHYCNDKDPKYNWPKCMAGEVFEGTRPQYTESSGYNGKYYYHIKGFAAFHVDEVVKSGPDKGISGRLISYVTDADWIGPSSIATECGATNSFGVAVVKLTK